MVAEGSEEECAGIKKIEHNQLLLAKISRISE